MQCHHSKANGEAVEEMESEDEAFIPLPATQASAGAAFNSVSSDVFCFPDSRAVDGAHNCNNAAESQELRPPPGLITDRSAGWLKYAQQHEISANVSPFVRLHNEILEFCDYVKLDEEEVKARQRVIKDIEKIALGLWPEATVHVFGSEFTGVLLPTSDLDFVVMRCPDDAHDALYALQEAIEGAQLASYIEVIANAKVPIVKMDHAATGIAVDICCNVTNGLNTGRIIREFIEEFPQLMPLTLVLKTFLAQRKLNETYQGGVGSFLLVLMIVSFLQLQRRLAESRIGAATANLGALLVDVLELYGKTFNYYTTAISVRDGGYYFPKRQRFDWCVPNRPWALCVENPDQTDLDVGKNSFEIRKVKRAFEAAHTALCAALCSAHEESYLAYLIRPDDPALVDRPIRRWDRFELRKLLANRSVDLLTHQCSDDETEDDLHDSDDSDDNGHYAIDHRSEAQSNTASNGSNSSKKKKKRQKQKQQKQKTQKPVDNAKSAKTETQRRVKARTG